mmetsp:Transcript_2601/g.3631  ORF Transcript_2601/g.3631 Transcript_2601/m.3631 type:complete len:948 (-) Transcript_2601:12-2855(-)
MATVHFKFRSMPNYEALHLPGTGRAKLFDIKRAIVKHRKLDSRSTKGKTVLDFDLKLRNAATNEELIEQNNEQEFIDLRGIRLIVQRVPSARGAGLLARLARLESGMADVGSMAAPARRQQMGTSNAMGENGMLVNTDQFYTHKTHEAEEELVDINEDSNVADTRNNNHHISNQSNSEEAELAAITGAANMYRPGATSKSWVAGQSAVPLNNVSLGGVVMNNKGQYFQQQQQLQANQHRALMTVSNKRNADPEMRELQAQQQNGAPKKRATGIPRTFMSSSMNTPAIPGLSADDDPDSSTSGAQATEEKLQPNLLGFEALVVHKGGKSAYSSQNNLIHALTITNTTVPEHLQCAICHNVARTAMFLPWDLEGRTACEQCIRQKLLENHYRCPITGNEGVNPEELRPNIPLRKTVDMFIEGVMKVYEEVVTNVEEGDDVTGQDIPDNQKSGNVMEEVDDPDENVGTQASQPLGFNADDPVGGDAFGGDIFAVAAPIVTEKEPEVEKVKPEEVTSISVDIKSEIEQSHNENRIENETSKSERVENIAIDQQPDKTTKPDNLINRPDASHQMKKVVESASSSQQSRNHYKSISPIKSKSAPSKPPSGYAMGPANTNAAKEKEVGDKKHHRHRNDRNKNRFPRPHSMEQHPPPFNAPFYDGNHHRGAPPPLRPPYHHPPYRGPPRHPHQQEYPPPPSHHYDYPRNYDNPPYHEPDNRSINHGESRSYEGHENPSGRRSSKREKEREREDKHSNKRSREKSKDKDREKDKKKDKSSMSKSSSRKRDRDRDHDEKSSTRSHHRDRDRNSKSKRSSRSSKGDEKTSSGKDEHGGSSSRGGKRPHTSESNRPSSSGSFKSSGSQNRHHNEDTEYVVPLNDGYHNRPPTSFPPRHYPSHPPPPYFHQSEPDYDRAPRGRGSPGGRGYYGGRSPPGERGGYFRGGGGFRDRGRGGRR